MESLYTVKCLKNEDNDGWKFHNLTIGEQYEVFREYCSDKGEPYICIVTDDLVCNYNHGFPISWFTKDLNYKEESKQKTFEEQFRDLEKELAKVRKVAAITKSPEINKGMNKFTTDGKIYIKVKYSEDNKNFFAFNCKGGWVNCDDLKNDESFITIQCDDDYIGHRCFSIDKRDLIL